MCLFDTGGDINDNDHLLSVFNVGTSIGKVGFFGEASQKLWCSTLIETLSVWDWNESKTEANFDDARALASESWTLGHVDYSVNCHYSPEEDGLWVIGGTNSGTFGGHFPVKYSSRKMIGPAEAVFQGGHAGVVRGVLPMSSVLGSSRRGVFGLSGGEDGRLCCWSSDESSETNGPWVSTATALVEKSKYNIQEEMLPLLGCRPIYFYS